MKTPPRQLILGLGSNLGEKATFLAQAVVQIAQIPSTKVLTISTAVDSEPVGFLAQQNFLNLCLLISSELNPDELLTATLAIEQRLGRRRTGHQNGPRTIDIDLLFYEGGAWNSPTVTLPHPRWSSRGFVVIPLRNLLQTPDLAIDAWGRSLQAEVDALSIRGEGLRVWQGPTPWIQSPR